MNDHKKTKTDLIKELQELRKLIPDSQSQHKHHHGKGLHPEMMLHKMIAHSPISIQMLDKDGFSVSVNEAHTEFFGTKPPPDYNMFRDPLLLKQDLESHFSRLRQGEAVFFPDTWYNTHLLDSNFPDKTVWLKSCGISVPDTDGKPQFYIIMHENITERIMHAQEQKVMNDKLHLMASHLQNSIEKERKYLSDELHDQVGQLLTGLKIDMDDMIMDGLQDEMKLKINDFVARINELIRTVQNLTATIRPMMLRDMGMKQNMEWLISEFEQRTKMEVFVNIDYSIDLPEEAAICVFRILQEALTNISRHSKATQARIIIKKTDESVHITVSDNGIGITDDQINSQDSSGIIIMNERVDSLGGKFYISTHNNSGTKIDIQFPLIQHKL